jgi:hypothetical protein
MIGAHPPCVADEGAAAPRNGPRRVRLIRPENHGWFTSKTDGSIIVRPRQQGSRSYGSGSCGGMSKSGNLQDHVLRSAVAQVDVPRARLVFGRQDRRFLAQDAAPHTDVPLSIAQVVRRGQEHSQLREAVNHFSQLRRRLFVVDRVRIGKINARLGQLLEIVPDGAAQISTTCRQIAP